MIMVVPEAGAQRRPEITPGYDTDEPVEPSYQRTTLNEGRRLPPATTRKPRFYSRRSGAQRRPEITPGYDLVSATHLPGRFGAQRRPEITPGYDLNHLYMHAGRCAAQRRPEITPGYDPVCANRPGAGCALNEGRRLPPATTGRGAGGPVGASSAQRRPEITPGYDPKKSKRWRRIDALNEGRRLPPATTRIKQKRNKHSWKALNEGRRLPPATTPARITRPRRPRTRAQRRPEITPGYDLRARGPEVLRGGLRSTKAGDYPRLRRGFGGRSRRRGRSALNEGRRLPPATTSRRQANTLGKSRAQRRPEITPGYDS